MGYIHKVPVVLSYIGPYALTKHQGLDENNSIIYTNGCCTPYELEVECLEIGKQWRGTVFPKGKDLLGDVRKRDEEP